MSDTWTTRPATEIEPGVIVKLYDGSELEVSRVEGTFLGMDTMLAFIEDTPQRWLKAPYGKDAEIEFRLKS